MVVVIVLAALGVVVQVRALVTLVMAPQEQQIAVAVAAVVHLVVLVNKAQTVDLEL